MPLPDPDLDQPDDLATAMEFWMLAALIGGAFVYGIWCGVMTLF